VRPSTGALSAPAQDEAIFFVPSKFYLILSLRPQGACRRTHDTNAAPFSEGSPISHTLYCGERRGKQPIAGQG
jgi:hypothetical protein